MSFLNDYKSYLMEPSRYAGLDWLRAFACLAVVLFHYMNLNDLSPVFHLGWMGVDLFFVLSGFLIGSILFSSMTNIQKSFSYSNFVKNRFLRIYPLFLFVFVAGALLKGGTSLSPEFWSEFLKAFGISFLMGQTIYQFFDITINESIFGVEGSWTLVIEWYFYLCAPLLVWIVIKLDAWRANYGFGFLVALFVSGVLVRYLILYPYPATDMNWHFAIAVRPPGRYDVLVAGLICAYAVFKQPKFSFGFLFAPFVVILSLIVSYLYLNPNLLFSPVHLTREVIIYPLLVGIGFGCLLLSTYKTTYAPAIINILARLSYAMYLLHFVVIWASKHYGVPLNPIAYMSAVVGISLLANLFIEYPCLRLYKKR